MLRRLLPVLITALVLTPAATDSTGVSSVTAALLPGVSVSGRPHSSTLLPPPARWDWPGEEPRVILRSFIAPAHRYGAGHRGVDIATTGEVRAPADGVVHFTGTVVDRPVLSLAHAGGFLSSFEPVTTTLRTGDAVVRGQVVGEVDTTSTTAHCRAPCVHFGVRLDGEYLSPLILVGAVPRSVLLPMH
jgi:murein DD-endopeptidase MepM/ murein hydrolase activator NlpD